jgi:hypothetical protein
MSLPERWRWCDRPWLCDARKEQNALHTLIHQRRLTPSCGGLAPTAERTMDPARIFTESLTPRPELENNQGQTRRSKQHHYSISSSARTTRHVEAECLGGFEIDCEGVTARRRVAGQFECAPYENRADARGGSDDENSHCSNGCRDLGKCDIRRANHGGCALRRLRGRRQRTAGRCAPRLCVLSGLWGTPARAQLQLVPHAGL